MNFEPFQLEVEGYIRSGQPKKANQAIAAFLRKNKMNSEIKFHSSIWYSNLGNPIKALKVLGKELSFYEIQQAGVYEKKVQLRLAYMLSFFGAMQSAQRIIQKILLLPNEKSELPLIYRYAGAIYFRKYDFQNAKIQFEASEKIARQNQTYQSYLSGVNQIALADCLDALGHCESAIACVEEIIQWQNQEAKNIQKYVFLSLGEYFLRSFDLERAELFFQKAQKELASDSKDLAFLYKWQGVRYLLLKKKKEASRLFSSTQKILVEIDQSTASLFEVVFWMYLADDVSLSDSVFWPLLTHSMKHPLAFYLRENVDANLPWKKFYSATLPKAKCLKNISKNKIFMISCGKMDIRDYQWALVNVRKQCLDLVSGYWHANNNLSLSLSAQEYKILNLLARAGSYGLNLYALIDYLYDQELADPESMILRVEKAINRLGRHDIEIKRQKNIFKLSEEINMIISPNFDHKPDPLYYCCRKFRSFRISDLVNNCDLSKLELKKLLIPHLKSGILKKTTKDIFEWRTLLEF